MYVQQSFERPQLPLFDAFLGRTPREPQVATGDISRNEDDQAFSELALRGAAGHCLHLLAPILRELSENLDARWLTMTEQTLTLELKSALTPDLPAGWHCTLHWQRLPGGVLTTLAL